MQIDFLIVGQGLSGSFLSWYLLRSGASFIVVDENKSNTASRVAAGLINPVTGRRLVRSWMIEELMPFAWNAYDEIGSELSINCIRETKLQQFFIAPDMQDAFNKKLLEKPKYLLPPSQENWNKFFGYPFGWGTVAPCYIVNTRSLLHAYRAAIESREEFLQEKFDVTQLQVHTGHIQYKDIKASKVIFCDGAAGFDNPWFNKLPYSPNKGEALLVHIPGLPADHIYKFRHTLIPVDAAASLFWFGSSYEWTYTDDLPSENFYKHAESELKRFLKLPFTITDHEAAVRAANVERRPFVGLHPHQPQIGILNGMGTKGCSL
ncbi:MAG TPA: FAD-dependent oxidoreductase, partial [Chitinophagaceae bacterium]